jgi:hypothetical protein
MALRFIDSFNHYNTSTVPAKWNISQSFATPTIVTGRNGNGLRLVGSFFANSYVYKVLDNQTTYMIGVAINLTVGTAGAQGLLAVWDGLTRQVGVRVNNSSKLEIEKNGTVLATSSGSWVNGWNYVEIKTFFNTGSGSCIVRVNGNVFVTYSGNISQSGVNQGNKISIGDWVGNNNQADTIWDDLYVCDGTGSVNNDFLGDIVVEALYPNGAGSYTQFTPVGAGANYNAVNQTVPDGDTTYNYDNTVGNRDSFTFSDFSQGVLSVFGVQSVLDARKQGSGTRSVGPFFRASTTNYDQTAAVINDTYSFYVVMNELNPATTALWTESEVNAIEAGYRITV